MIGGAIFLSPRDTLVVLVPILIIIFCSLEHYNHSIRKRLCQSGFIDYTLKNLYTTTIYNSKIILI